MLSVSVKNMFDYGVLNQDVHQSLAKNMGKISIATGVPAKYIYTEDSKNDGVCLDVESDWVKQCRQHRKEGTAGLVLTGTDFNHSPEEKMMVMGGKLIRNFIDARIVIVQELLEEMKEGTIDNSDVLLIPNFFIAKKGVSLPDWQVNLLQGLLIKRLCSSNLTILYIQGMNELKQSYGQSMYSHIHNNYDVLE